MAEAPHPKGNDGKSPRLIRPRGVAPKTVRRKAGSYRPLASFSLELRNDKANMRRLSSNSARPAGLGPLGRGPVEQTQAREPSSVRDTTSRGIRLPPLASDAGPG